MSARTLIPLALIVACTANPPQAAPTPAAAPATPPPTPPAGTSPVETPPVETPPVETPPLETPPVETPPSPTTVALNLGDIAGAYVAHEGRDWIVDIIELPRSLDLTAMNKRLETVDPGGEIVFKKPRDPALPAGFAVGDPWTLITRDGAEPRKASAYAASVSDASSTLHFTFHLGPAAAGAEGHALALRGHHTRPLKLLVPPAEELPAGMLDRVVKELTPHFEPELRDSLSAIKFKDADLKLYPGRFPGGRSHVGFLAALPGDDEDRPPASGVVFTYPDGRVEHFTVAGVLGVVELLGVVDLDGDGTDEVAYDDSYHEGWYVELLHWTDGRPVNHTLTGDGL